MQHDDVTLTTSVEELNRSKADDDPATSVGRRSFLVRGGLGVSAVAGALHMGLPTAVSAQEGQTANQIRRNFMDIRRHENDHVAALIQVLGANARPKPTFRNLIQPNLRTFYQVAQDLENTGVGAYLGATPAILSRQVLAGAGSIALIEGRHAGWINTLVGGRITENVFGREQSFEMPLTPAQVVALAGPFIASLNGGPPPTYSTTPSPENDIAILNFALALEYLEAEFYNLNFPRLFEGREGGGQG